MPRQRNLFWGKSPAKSVKKDGENRPVAERRFTALRLEDIEVSFTNTTVTQFGGYPLWAAFAKGAGLDARFARHIKMNRGPNAFTAPELSRFFIDACVLGAGRLSHVDRMRCDPMLVQAHGVDTLASDETLGRYFKAYEERQLAALERMNVWFNASQWKRARRQGHRAIRSGKVILDYDSTTSTVYGKQEGADRGHCFRKKDKPGFQTKFAFIGGLGLMVHQQLYPQSHNLPKGFEAFHAATLRRLPKGAKVWAIRADGALYAQKRIEAFEKQGYVYAVTASRTKDLHEVLIGIPEESWEEGTDAKGRPYSIARITYCPKTWTKARTYVVSRRLKDLRGQQVLWDWERYDYFAYVTNYRAPLLAQWQFCVERCSLENFIKEGKHGFSFTALPCRELSANRAYTAHVQMAYNGFLWWKLFGTPAGINRWTIATVRERLLNICGNLVREAGRWVLSLPAWWSWRTVYTRLAVRAGFAAG